MQEFFRLTPQSDEKDIALFSLLNAYLKRTPFAKSLEQDIETALSQSMERRLKRMGKTMEDVQKQVDELSDERRQEIEQHLATQNLNANEVYHDRTLEPYSSNLLQRRIANAFAMLNVADCQYQIGRQLLNVSNYPAEQVEILCSKFMFDMENGIRKTLLEFDAIQTLGIINVQEVVPDDFIVNNIEITRKFDRQVDAWVKEQYKRDLRSNYSTGRWKKWQVPGSRCRKSGINLSPSVNSPLLRRLSY